MSNKILMKLDTPSTYGMEFSGMASYHSGGGSFSMLCGVVCRAVRPYAGTFEMYRH